MWLVTLFLLYSFQEVNSEDVVSTRLYFVNASLQRVTFSSSVGVSLPCPAGGAPHAVLRWYLATGDDIYDVPHIRHVHANGTLQLYPFSPSAFNSYIHDNDYFCTAENQAGKIRSPSIRIKAVFREPYTVRVADQRSMRGNVAVFKCLIPSAVQEYVSVVSWEKDTVSMVPGNRFFLTSFGALYISEVQKEDALSTYRCITKHKYSGETRQSNGARLSVMDPTESTPSVLDSFQSGEVQVGHNVELPCIASGYPNPTIRWLKDGRPLPADSRWTRRLTGLTVSDLRLGDSGNYICEVTNSFGSKEVTGHLNVIEPLRVTLSPKNLKTGISSTVILSCSVQGSPHFTLSWYRNTEPVLPDQHFSIQGAHNETLFISAAQKRHSGAYQCFATRKGQTAQDFSIILLEGGLNPKMILVRKLNLIFWWKLMYDEKLCLYFPVGPCPIISLVIPAIHPTFILPCIVLSPVPAMITSHPNTTMAIKGQIKELNCTARGEWPIIIRWERGDTVIDPDRNPRYAITTSPNEKSDEVLSTLKLKPAERGDSVFFSCHAINSYGEGRGLIQLTVQAHADPWELKHATRKISPTNNQANIVDLHPAQVYSIRMFSYNKIGHSQASKELTISTEEAQPDGPPMEVFLQPMTSQSIRVTWKAPRKELQNGVIRGYQIGYRENGPGSNGQYSIVEMKATGDSEVYTLDNLKKFAQYGVVVQAFNRAGTGPSSSEINATTLEDVPSQPPQTVRAISVTSDEAVITWAEPPRLTLHGVLKGYRVVFWSLFPDGEWGEMQNITTTREQVELRGLEKFTNYSVQVLAYTQAGDGVRSNVLYIQTREDHPGPPAGIKAVPSSTSSVVVSWLPPHKPNGIIRKYTIYCSSPGSGQPAPSEYEANPELLFYRVTHLNRGQQYLIWAAAVTTAGRGNISDKVTVEPAGKAPAKILSFGGTVTTPWMKEVRLPCSSVGEPTPTIKWTKDSEDTAIPVTLDGQRLIMVNGTLVLRSVKAEDSGYYTCTATNTLGFDTIIVNLLVQVPPDQPRLTVSTTSPTSITLAWIPGDNGGSSIRGFVLQYSVDNMEGWRDVFISSSERSFKLDNLRCGTWYKVKLAAKNSVGAGRISEIIEAKTHGREPQFNNEQPVFTHVNSTHARLNLQGWASGGCPITAVLLEFRPKGNWAWQNVRTNATADVFLAELREATWYELKMKACNSAGCGNQSSQFATLDYDGSTIPPIKSARPEGDDVKKLFSIGCPVILVTLVLALLFIIRKKRKEKRLKRLRDAKSLAEMLISKNNRSFDTPVKGPPQGPRLHIDIPRVQLLIEDKEGIKQIGEDKATIPVTDTEFSQNVNPQSFCTGVSVHHPALIQNTGPLIDMSDIRPGTNPVSRKSVKSAHSTRNRYSSQWTLTKCQSSTPARTLTSDWRTVGSQHGITVTESDSYSASLSQDTDKGRNSMVSTESASSTYEELARAYEHAKLEEHLQHAKFEITECFISDSSSDQMTTGTNDNGDSMTSMSTPSETGLCRFTASPPKPQEYDRGRPTNVAVPIPHRANKSEWTGKSDYCNLPLYMKTDPFFRKQSELHDPCPVVPPREAPIRSLAQRAYHTQGRHMTLDSSKQQQALTVGHAGLAGLSASGGASGSGGGGVGGATGGPSGGSSTTSLSQRTLTMPGSSSSSAQSAAAAATASASGGATGGDSRDPLLESSSSGLGRLERQKQAAGGAYSKSYTLV
nr:LOW QUALITY PROTEIN: Down syndrome cell adhesion molecule-like protein 1 homolog [Oncorhynchus nerka]